MQCPKCGAAVDKGSATCPICFADLSEDTAAGAAILSALNQPIPKEEEYLPVAGIPGIDNRPQEEAPVANYLSGTQQGPAPTVERRVSLTGEVIEVASAPQAVAAPMPGYAPPPAGQPMGPSTMRPPNPAAPPARKTSYTMPARRESAPARSGGGAGVLIAVIVVLLLAGGGGFGYWYWQKQRAPIVAAEKLMAAQKSGDYATVLDMVELPPQIQQMVTNAGVSKDQMIQGAKAMGQMAKITDYKIGEATVTGDTATVQITSTVNVSSQLAGMTGQKAGTQTITQSAPFKLVNGVWKLDASKAQGLGTAMAGGTQMGRPMGGGGGGAGGGRRRR